MKIKRIQNITIAEHRLLRIDYTACDGLEDWVLVRLPEQGQDWVVCIHGHGSNGDQLYTREDIKNIWLPEFVKLGLGILTPNLRGNAWMGPQAVADMDALLEYARSEWNAQKFMFASGSMGGTSNLIYAALRPKNVQAVVALGAASDLASYHTWCRERNQGTIMEIADAIENSYDSVPGTATKNYLNHSVLENAQNLIMPVYIAHGSQDMLIPVSQMRRLCGLLAEKSEFVYSEIPDGNHDSPLHMTETFTWAVEKMKSAAKY